MSRKARLSVSARAYFRREIAYLAPRSPAACLRLIERMEAARERLIRFPLSGPVGIVPGTRRLVVDGYILTYVVTSATIEIVSIRHGRQGDPDAQRSGDDRTEPSDRQS